MALSKTCLVLYLAVVPFVLMMNLSEAFSANLPWAIPPRQDAFNIWAQKQRFHIHDSIVFQYSGSKNDSVLYVNQTSYENCNTSNFINRFDVVNGAPFGFEFWRSGPFFFISGADGHCEQGQKLNITVLAAPHHHHHHNSTAAPAPSPLPIDNKHHHGHAPAPAPAPHSGGASLGVGAVVSVSAALVVALL